MKNNVKESAKFFAHYLKHFKVALFFILVLTILATWLQVKAPVYMGRSIKIIKVNSPNSNNA